MIKVNEHLLSEPRELRVGELRVQCRSGQDCVGRLAVSRGLLSCCRKDVLLCGKEVLIRVGGPGYTSDCVI